MKELTIEQKAKAHEKAFRIAQELYNDPNSSNVGKGYVYTVFPELKESEDERIRKELINYFIKGKEYLSLCSFSKEEILAWLEKQVTPQVRTGIEWVNKIDDACDNRYLEEYAHGEYCHEQSFKWGFQEGVD